MRTWFIPIVWKIGLAIVAVVSVFGSINIYLIQRNVAQSLRSNADELGTVVGRQVAEQIVNPLLVRDLITLREIIDNALISDPLFAYLFVVDPTGTVVTHSFTGGFPTELLEARSSIPDSQPIRIESTNAPGSNFRDLSVPILGGQLGTLRLGLFETGLSSDVRSTIRIFGIMVAIFLFLGLVGAVIFARYLTQPIQEISDFADRVDLKSLQQPPLPRVSIRTRLTDRFSAAWRINDELDILTAHFNEMIVRLEQAYTSIADAQRQMFQSEKMASVGTLAAGIAHEINNPIAGLKNCVRRLQQNPGNIEQNEKYLELMGVATERIEQVVRGLLDFTRISKADSELVDIRKLIGKSLMLASFNLERVRIPVRQEIIADAPAILVDSNQIQQVFLNIILNGIHAIETRREKQPGFIGELLISASESENGLLVTISDDGIGIPESIRDKIFDPFFTTKQEGEGTGLGLAVCDKIIRAHGGRISVHSDGSSGTSILIWLPTVASSPGSLTQETSYISGGA